MSNPPRDPLVVDPQSQSAAKINHVGYRKPPRHSQFVKGRSGNPSGRPKRPVGTSIKEILDGDQRGKNGEIISRREAYVIALVNEACEVIRRRSQVHEADASLRTYAPGANINSSGLIEVPTRKMTAEEYEEFKRNFGRRADDESTEEKKRRHQNEEAKLERVGFNVRSGIRKATKGEPVPQGTNRKSREAREAVKKISSPRSSAMFQSG